MQITAENLGRKFNRDWIFRNLSLDFQTNKSYAITGPNGSGKSTLLQVMTGIIPLTEGQLIYRRDQTIIHPDDYYKYLNIATPYQEVIEEFSLKELLDFHLRFKQFKEGITRESFYDRLKLSGSVHKEIRFFSSGMKQRVKLGLALYSVAPVVFLDEPTTNLDAQGIDWYQQEVVQHLHDRIVIICSNQKYEYDFCNEIVHLSPNVIRSRS